ncbi:MAG: hypothetical protein KAR38_04985 [Calditrichia bacterium]|nr:hypothetical protein [Calditrichia bacterium]
MSVQGSATSSIMQNSQEMKAVISKAIQQQQELAEKMIKSSIEAKVAHGKSILLGRLVDLSC